MDKKILIVDDMDLNRMILGEILSENYEILEASDGKEALDIINEKSNNIGAIFLDIVMPVMDGIDVLKDMNSGGLTGTIPVIIVTGDATEDIISTCRKLGAADFIKKPFSSAVVREKLKKVM